MKFEITSVYDTPDETQKLYGTKAKKYNLKLEEISGHTVATIEIESIEDLLKLSNKVGHSIVFNDAPLWDDVGLPVLQIYDGYRE